MLHLQDTLASAPLDDRDRQAALEAEFRKRDLAPEIFEIETPNRKTLPVANVRVTVPGHNQDDEPIYLSDRSSRLCQSWAGNSGQLVERSGSCRIGRAASPVPFESTGEAGKFRVRGSRSTRLRGGFGALPPRPLPRTHLR